MMNIGKAIKYSGRAAILKSICPNAQLSELEKHVIDVNNELAVEIERLKKEIAGGKNKYARDYCSEFNKLLAAKQRELTEKNYEIEKLREENERLKTALTGAWLNYDAIQSQMGTPDYENIEMGTLQIDSKFGSIRLYKKKRV